MEYQVGGGERGNQILMWRRPGNAHDIVVPDLAQANPQVCADKAVRSGDDDTHEVNRP